MRHLLPIVIFCLLVLTGRSTVWTATNCPASWGASPYPFWNGSTQLTSANIANGDVLVIPANCTINISGVVTMAADIGISLNGVLNFPTTGDKLNLTASSSVIAGPTGSLVGISNSNQIKIGTGGAEWSGPGTTGGPFIMTNGFLPIELIAFTGDFEQKVVFLSWKTATETKNDYFEIEKSSDGINFYKLAKVESQAENGTSTSVLEYHHTDTDMQHPLYYYRLKQVDLNGEARRTNAISVRIYTAEFSIYPNPNSGTFSINVPSVKLHEQLTVKIYDSRGTLIYDAIESVKNNNITGSVVDIKPAQVLPKGIYMSNITFQGETHKLKLVVN